MTKTRTRFTLNPSSGFPPNLDDPDYEGAIPVQPILYEDHPYEPPHLYLETREEAIFLLAHCGANVLAEPIHLIQAFSHVFRYREKIRKHGCCISSQGEPLDEQIRNHTESLVHKWVEGKPLFFTGLSELAVWLREACKLIGHNDIFSLRCVQQREYKSLAHGEYDGLCPATLDELADEMREIVEACNWRWTFRRYLELMSQYMTKIKESNQKAADSVLKKELLKQLESSGLYNAVIPDFLGNSLDEYVLAMGADIFINGVQEALEDDSISFNIIAEQIWQELGRRLGNTTLTPPMAQQINVPDITSQVNFGPKLVVNVDDFLQSDKHFSQNFFVLFCVAYVETHLASIKDPDADPQQTTNWFIYNKMRELNNGDHIDPIGRNPNASEKDDKELAVGQVSRCKGHLRKFHLPASPRNQLSIGEIMQYIDFFKKIPKISKYLSRALFIQQVVNQCDTNVIEGPPQDFPQ